MTKSAPETFSLEWVQWPNAMTEFWFKVGIVEVIPKLDFSKSDEVRFKFVDCTDFAAFERSELELILNEKIAFSLQDLREMLESANNNPLSGRETASFDFDFIEHMAQNIHVNFIVTLIDEILTTSLKGCDVHKKRK